MITSLEISECFEKEHKYVVRDLKKEGGSTDALIRRYCVELYGVDVECGCDSWSDMDAMLKRVVFGIESGVTSLVIAEHFCKAHKGVLKDVRAMGGEYTPCYHEGRIVYRLSDCCAAQLMLRYGSFGEVVKDLLKPFGLGITKENAQLIAEMLGYPNYQLVKYALGKIGQGSCTFIGVDDAIIVDLKNWLENPL